MNGMQTGLNVITSTCAFPAKAFALKKLCVAQGERSRCEVETSGKHSSAASSQTAHKIENVTFYI